MDGATETAGRACRRSFQTPAARLAGEGDVIAPDALPEARVAVCALFWAAG